MSRDGFWNDQEKAQEIGRRRSDGEAHLPRRVAGPGSKS
jgi:hypothetical protein